MAGGLFDPLGTDRPARPRGGSRPAAAVVAAGLAAAAVAALVAVSWWRDDGDRGRPVAVAPIEHRAAPPKPPAAIPAPPPLPPPSTTFSPPGAVPATPPQDADAFRGLPPVRDDQEVEIQNGVRIVRPRRNGPGSQTIQVPDKAQR